MIRSRLLAPFSGLALVLAMGSATAQDAAARGPQPNLDPPQVVEAMLAALKKGNDQGIAELYKFSSPGNREKTGPLESFRTVIKEGFPDLLGYHAARTGAPLIDGARAMVPVEVAGSDDQPHRYVFVLSKQDLPECHGCWMADAVFSPDQEEQGPGEQGPGEPGPGPETPPQYGA